MAEPKYYDELPTYIMHSDGEFKEGVFKAVDGSGNSLTIRTEKDDREEKLIIEGGVKAEFSTALETFEAPYSATLGAFSAIIGGISAVLGVQEINIDEMKSVTVSFIFQKGDVRFRCVLPTMEQINEELTEFKNTLPKNIKDGSGTNSLAGNSLTSANGMSQTVIGKYNVKQGNADTTQPTDYAFIIGNGSSNNARSNAFAVRWDGAIVLANGTVLTVEQLAKVANLT